MEPLRSGDPRQVGSYRLLGRLGSGGMGQVFLGESPGHRKVAVKLVHPEHADDTMFRNRFAREVEAARKVGGFHTAQVVDADPDAEPPWLVTAYIPGPSLAAKIRDDGPMAPEAVSKLGAALAEGLAAIHACELVHRDLKPANIILAEDGPRIIDFGVARAPDASSLTSTGTLVGTVAFMSPEQVHGEHVDARSDVFSFGGVLTYAATGHGPFDADMAAAMVYRIANGPPNLDGISGPLLETITACLAKDAAQRPSLPDLTVKLADQNHKFAERPALAVRPEPERARPPSPSATLLPALPPAGRPAGRPAGHPAGRPTEAVPPLVPPAAPTVDPAPQGAGPTAPARRPRWPSAVLPVLAIAGAVVMGIVLYNVVGNSPSGNTPGAAGTHRPTVSVGRGPAGSAFPSTAPGTTPTPAASGHAGIPDGYDGLWEGTLQDHTGREGPQDVELTLYGSGSGSGSGGSLVGTASYPDIGCDYTDKLVSAQPDEVILYETVQGGPCVNEYAVLTPSGEGFHEDLYVSNPSSGGAKPTLSGDLANTDFFGT
jgi:tRNA A-37 threonylcarbamoyl transferase component Bud32